jgi:triacylglycerol lipase
MKILLAHGVLGFGRFAGLDYFNGVVRHLEDRFRGEVQVAIAQVDAIGSIQARADQLAGQIVAGSGGEKVHVFAHSMGGLDARWALSNNLHGVREHVARLVMIGTPNLGSPVADAIESGDPAALRHLPKSVVELHINQEALHDLTTRESQRRDLEMEDVSPIVYEHVAGDMTAHGAAASRTFKDLAAFFDLTGPNDGVVTMHSATTRCGKPQTPIEVWPCDHAGEVGWNLDNLQPAFIPFTGIPNLLANDSHLARYERLVRRALGVPASATPPS